MKRIAGMASIKGREASLRDTLNSLTPQMDHIFVYLNDYDNYLEWMTPSTFVNVTFLLGKEHAGDLGDSAKFFKYSAQDAYFFSVDDDLIYPKDYADTMIKWLSRTDDQALVTAHGKLFLENIPLRSFLKNPYAMLSPYLKDVFQHQFVHFGGTGVMCFNSTKIPLDMTIFGSERNMADVWVAIFAQRHSIPILSIPHSRFWFKHSDKFSLKDTIFSRSVQADIPCKVINRELALSGLVLNSCKLS